MDGFVRRLTSRLLERGREGDRSLSRNRHFEVFRDAPGKQALRLYRHLRSIEHDLLQVPGAAVAVHRLDPEGTRVQLRIDLPGGGGTRSTYLSADEFDLLLTSPGVRFRLAG
jgi:hypothetical protein